MFEVPFFNWIFLFFLLVLETPLIMSVFCVCAWVCVCSINKYQCFLFVDHFPGYVSQLQMPHSGPA